MVIGDNALDYDGSIKESKVDLITMKMLLNIILSAPGSKFMTARIKKLALKTDLYKKQCVPIPVELTLEGIMGK